MKRRGFLKTGLAGLFIPALVTSPFEDTQVVMLRGVLPGSHCGLFSEQGDTYDLTTATETNVVLKAPYGRHILRVRSRLWLPFEMRVVLDPGQPTEVVVVQQADTLLTNP